MKPLSKLMITGALAVSCSFPASAQSWGDFLKKTAADVVETALLGESDDAEPAPEPPTAIEAPEIVQMHDYEGELSMHDMYCETLLEPFDISNNLESLFTNAISDNADVVINIIKGKKVEFSEQEALDRVKVQAKRLNWLPMNLEVEYGKRLFEFRMENDTSNVLPPEGKGRVKRLYAQANALVGDVAADLGFDNPYTFTVLLINNKDVNATALPGGYMFMNIGVLESDHAELVVAHELGHVLKRHQTREAQAKLIDSIKTVDELKSLLRADEKAYEDILGRTISFYNAFQSYSRQQELQADACAVQIAGRHHVENLPSMIDMYVDSLIPDVVQSEPMNESLTEEKMLDDIERALKLMEGGHPDYPERHTHMTSVATSIVTAGI